MANGLLYIVPRAWLLSWSGLISETLVCIPPLPAALKVVLLVCSTRMSQAVEDALGSKCIGSANDPPAFAYSGWQRHGSPFLDGGLQTQRALSLATMLECVDADEDKDHGIPGQYNACHAERQLFVNFIDNGSGTGSAV
jgi:hypothetical protein